MLAHKSTKQATMLRTRIREQASMPNTLSRKHESMQVLKQVEHASTTSTRFSRLIIIIYVSFKIEVKLRFALSFDNRVRIILFEF